MQYLRNEWQSMVIATSSASLTLVDKGGVMKPIKLDAPRATLLLALFVGLGLAFHPMFFIFTLLIALAFVLEHFHPIARRGAHC